MSWPPDDLVPAGWQVDTVQGDGEGVVSADSTIYRTGTHSVKFLANGTTTLDTHFITAGEVLGIGDTITFWFRSGSYSGGGGPWINVDVEKYDEGDEAWYDTSTVIGSIAGGATTWVERQFEATEDGVFRLRFKVVDYYEATPVEVYVDDYVVDVFVIPEEDISDAAEASSTMEYEQIGFAADLLSTAAGTSSMSAQPIFFATVSGAGSAASTLSVGVIHQGDITSSGVGTSPMTTQALLNALLFSTIAANSTQALEAEEQAVWVLNTETDGSVRYENYAFNSFAKIGDSYYGCKADGIYKLEGDDDAGDPIQAMLSFGKWDFGTSYLKQVPHCYVGVSSNDRVFMKVIVEGEEYLYVANSNSEHMQAHRVDLGRGLEATYFEFELYNADGDDFELASVEFVVVPTTRRV